MKMNTEEAFIKVLQMHGIEHAFGIIGSAMMPISDLFPKAGITFWDVADEKNGGYMADGYSRATGKMSMAIAQNGPGVTGFVTPVTGNSLLKTCTTPCTPWWPMLAPVMRWKSMSTRCPRNVSPIRASAFRPLLRSVRP